MLCDVIIRILGTLEDIEQISMTGLDYHSTSEPIVIFSIHTKSPHELRFPTEKFTCQKDSPSSTHVQVTLRDLGGFTGLIAMHKWIQCRLPNFEQEIISNAIRYQYSKAQCTD